MSSKKPYFYSLTAGFIATLAISATAFAGNVVTKQARSNDVVSSYSLDTNTGSFWRNMERHGDDRDRNRRNDQRCDITSNVSDFKVSQHPNDAATAYYIKNGDLFYVKNTQQETSRHSSSCPPASTGKLIDNLKMDGRDYQYGVISSTNTEYVNYGLTSNGVFYAWKNSGQPLRVWDVSDVRQGCYGQKGKSYSQKILFLLRRNGTVLAMEEDGRTTEQQGSYRNLEDFKRSRNVCEDTRRNHEPEIRDSAGDGRSGAGSARE